MNQYIESNKIPSHLHSSSANTSLETQSAPPIKSAALSKTTNLLAEDSSLINLCTLNSFYQQLVGISPASLNTSVSKSVDSSSNLYTDHSNGMLLSKSNSSDSHHYRTTVATCDQSSNMSDSGVKSNVPDNSSNDSCVSKLISHKEYDLLTSQTNDNETTFNYELSSKVLLPKSIRFFILCFRFYYQSRTDF